MLELWVLHIASLRQTKFIKTFKGFRRYGAKKKETNDLQLWPWPCVCIIVEIQVLHIISLRRTFDPNLTRQSEWQWSGLKIQGSNWWLSIMTLTLSQPSWVMGSAHHLTQANIWPTFKENPSRGKGDMEPIWSRHQIQGSNSWPSWPWP